MSVALNAPPAVSGFGVVRQFTASAPGGGDVPSLTRELSDRFRQVYEEELKLAVGFKHRIAQITVQNHTQQPLESSCHPIVQGNITGAEVTTSCCCFSNLQFAQHPIFKSYDDTLSRVAHQLSVYIVQLHDNGGKSGKRLRDSLLDTSTEICRESRRILGVYRQLAGRVNEIHFKVLGHKEGTRTGANNAMQFMTSTFGNAMGVAAGMAGNIQHPGGPAIYNQNSAAVTMGGGPRYYEASYVNPLEAAVSSLAQQANAALNYEVRTIAQYKATIVGVAKLMPYTTKSQGIFLSHFINVHTINSCCSISGDFSNAMFEGSHHDIAEFRDRVCQFTSDVIRFAYSECCGPSSEWKGHLQRMVGIEIDLALCVANISASYRGLQIQFDSLHRSAAHFESGKSAGDEAGRREIQRGASAGVDVAAGGVMTLANAAAVAKQTLAPAPQVVVVAAAAPLAVAAPPPQA